MPARHTPLLPHLGQLDFEGARAEGIGRNEIVRHFLFYMEFVFREIEHTDHGQVVLVLDLTELSFWRLTSLEFLGTLRAFSEVSRQVVVARCFLSPPSRGFPSDPFPMRPS